MQHHRIASRTAFVVLGCVLIGVATGCSGGGGAVPAQTSAYVVRTSATASATSAPVSIATARATAAPIATSTATSTATPVATALPTVAASLAIGAPAHSLVYESANNPPSDFAATYGFDNWSYVRPYVDMISTGYAQAESAGVPLVNYFDPNLCSGSFVVGGNQYAGPDCNGVANGAFYTQPGHPDRPLAVSFNGSELQLFGDPGSTTMQNMMHAGTASSAARMPLAAIFVDDAETPSEYDYEKGLPMCWGAGTFSGSSYSCSGAPGGTAAAPFASNYSRGEWQQGEAGIAAAAAAPVIFNTLGMSAGDGQPGAIGPVAASAPNVWGAMCEGCFYGSAGSGGASWLYTDVTLDRDLSDVMLVQNRGRHTIVQNDNVTDPVQRARALADTMLVYDPKLTYESGPCGNRSHIASCIEASLVFEGPIGGYPASLAAITSTTGAYTRTFAACYVAGKSVGPCASVVNPKHDDSVTLPTSLAGFHHTLVLTGDSLCQCFGDSGSVSTQGAAAPAVLPPATGFVLFL